MGKSTRDSRGFTLIAALLLTVLLSGLAVGLLYLVNNEQHMGSNDLEGGLAFYGAEAGIENLTAQVSQLYETSQAPKAADIQALTAPANYPTNITGANITNMQYTIPPITWPNSDAQGNPAATWDIVGSGPDQGMVANIIPLNLQVTATRLAGSGESSDNASVAPTGASVNLTRTVEVALLPAFEFGVFCDGDCDYFAGPNFNFGGRVHTNGNLFLASGSTLTFTDKIAAVGQVVVDQLENGWSTGNGYTGQVYVPSAALACPAAPGSGPAANCTALPAGSWAGGFPPTPGVACADCAGAANPAWKGISTTTFNSYIINGLTGATKLQLPFVQGTSVGTAAPVGAIDIIRRPQATDTAVLASARLYAKAEIRILLADTLADLHPERGAVALDADDVQLGISPVTGGDTLSSQLNYPVATGGAGSGSYMYFGKATAGTLGWVAPTNPGTGTPYSWTSWPLLGQITSGPANVAGAAPNTVNVWLRVEYINGAGAWVGVTREWLQYGFGRGYNMPPTAPFVIGGANPACPTYPALPAAQCYNPVGPAILILQQLQQGDGVASAYEATGTNANGTNKNWIPINFYDSREGEPRDNQVARGTNSTITKNTTVYTPCSASGVMNAVELDAGNLWLWLQKSGPYAGGSGALVSTTDENGTVENGYIVYFSDHRGMIADPFPTGAALYNKISGMSGLEDTINSASVTGVPDNALEPLSYYTFSPEDLNADGNLDNYGEKNLGAGFGLTGVNTSRPYYPIPAGAATVQNPTGQVNCNSDNENAAGTLNTVSFTGTGSPQDNMVTGPRHVLRLVDGGMSNPGAVSYLPHPIAPALFGNGFTIASEEPVYVLGDYNSGIADPYFPTLGANATTPHSAAAIIADSVTLLSNPPSAANLPTANVGWTDVNSFLYPGDVSQRLGNNSYYRVAIAAGKSIPFPQPGWANAIPIKDFGTDGGMHNFLRYLEDRSDGGRGGTVNYAGSLISMYYSQYNTGIFKCCNVVYGAPTRNYFFDTQFLNPNNLPPGTPDFEDIVSLSYHQSFVPQ